MITTISITEVSRRSGVAASALRYYEELGLIASERRPAGHRRFARATLRRLAFIVAAQRIGLSLDEIRAELSRLPDGRTPTRDDWATLSSTWTSRIDRQIADLQRLKSGLAECIGCGCLSLDRCKLANPADKAGKAGPGARYLLGEPSQTHALEPSEGY